MSKIIHDVAAIEALKDERKRETDIADEAKRRAGDLGDKIATMQAENMGFRIGQTIEFPYGQMGSRKGIIVGFKDGYSPRAIYRTVKKDGATGFVRDLYLGEDFSKKVKILDGGVE